MEAIQNFVQIREGLATAGQPTIAQFQTIQEAGYTIVINLAVPTSEGAIAQEREIVEALGMQYFHIPVIWDQPTIADFEQFSNIMQHSQHESVFVHCAKNMRVSAFVYLYRKLHEHLSEEQAKADLLKIWHPNETWQKFIEAVQKAAVT
ncbi:protein tyrosine phosphatase family protein [Leptolyngbya boryana CZ1]|uniref:Protein tyrosine phosphatase family protein n=1 Tax=Leptolyngbya boryana CZ1 TaxID=3060204 RepID=A0AA96X073_LEPBY|nr:protein tyrosine phosphatase family protein [Leptolyngbya boryana]WNZ48328.1 protein tyrosine phosphatase family protein [Leptolyngbya boryana CZ1]